MSQESSDAIGVLCCASCGAFCCSMYWRTNSIAAPPHRRNFLQSRVETTVHQPLDGDNYLGRFDDDCLCRWGGGAGGV
ncbi:hypothetical protein, partial [Burkholderia stagnalis]|uniref:hypothetical protein n=1 Tax=Burkholderia stagnalis TaxID=1503054 RepID=UPI0035D6BDD0